MDQQSGHKNSAGEFGCAGSSFSMNLLEFMSKAIKFLLTELVGQCRNIFPLANMEKSAGNILLTSYSVNKSILLTSMDRPTLLVNSLFNGITIFQRL